VPIVVMLSGPNGAGKTTASRILLQGPLAVEAFVNADIIAQGLGGLSTDEADFEAARVMLERLDELAARNANFAFETTLASRSFADRMEKLKARDYIFALVYLWLPSAGDAIQRVRDRVRRGGHHVPDETVRRRYARGLRNFFTLYRPIADVWTCYDSTGLVGPRLVASGVRGTENAHDQVTWGRILLEVNSDSQK
jgi:predicted ABC-type ATPase